MKLLLLTPQLPYPPQQGTSLRNYHIICGLADDHELSLLSFDESPPITAATMHVLQALCRDVWAVPAPTRTTKQRLRQLMSGRQPDMALRLGSNAFEEALAQVLRSHDFDIVQIEGLELAPYIPTIRRVSPKSKIVFDNHNAETALQYRSFLTDLATSRRWPAAAYSMIQVSRLRRFEYWACRTADGVVAVSEGDRTALKKLLRGNAPPMMVIPNSIDVSQYDDSQLPLGELPGPFDLVFTGKMDYRPNVDAMLWFAEAMWPRIGAARPNATWAIVGQKPHARLERLSGEAGITLTGRVESVVPYLKAAAIYIMPLRIGSGTRLKLLEAMAARKAIVSTTIGVEGFPVQTGRELVIADSPEEMATAISILLDDSAIQRRLGTAARTFAAQYDWRRIVPLFNQVYNNLVRANSR